MPRHLVLKVDASYKPGVYEERLAAALDQGSAEGRPFLGTVPDIRDGYLTTTYLLFGPLPDSG